MTVAAAKGWKEQYFAAKARVDALGERLRTTVLAPADREREEQRHREAKTAERQLWGIGDATDRALEDIAREESELRPLRRVRTALRREVDDMGVRADNPVTRDEALRALPGLEQQLAFIDYGPAGDSNVVNVAAWRPSGELAERLVAVGLRLDVRLGLKNRERRLREMKEEVRELEARLADVLASLERFE